MTTRLSLLLAGALLLPVLSFAEASGTGMQVTATGSMMSSTSSMSSVSSMSSASSRHSGTGAMMPLYVKRTMSTLFQDKLKEMQASMKKKVQSPLTKPIQKVSARTVREKAEALLEMRESMRMHSSSSRWSAHSSSSAMSASSMTSTSSVMSGSSMSTSSMTSAVSSWSSTSSK